jgi:methyltransferase (TIGR00027 family)
MQGTPSRTAFGVAGRRAAHQLVDRPLVFEDPLAVRIVGGRVDTKESPVSRAMRAFMAVRSRYAEDNLATAVAHGVSQYVVLGAGLDTFAYRNPFGIRVFEVDHPATQAWKRELLAEAMIVAPETATFVAVDFERENLAHRLAGSGFQISETAFFCWLGVTPYLTREAFEETLGFLASTAEGSAVVFDWCVEPSMLSATEQMALEALAARVAAIGEPFQLYFRPDDLEGALRSAGFDEMETLGREEINERYFANRSDGLHVPGSAGRLTLAAKPRRKRSPY